MLRVKDYIKRPKMLFLAILKKTWWLFTDKSFLRIRFRLEMGKKLDLKNPKTFNEKLQWLKLYNRKPEYTTMVDKYAVKEYVAKIIGEEYIIPTLGVWNNPDEIEWDKLPNQFVLKTTHGGGGSGVVICKDKSTFDINSAIKKLQTSLRESAYRTYKEWPYKNVEKRIIAEQYIEDENGELNDYKFSCFDGYVHDVMVCLDRSTGDTKFYFFDSGWNLLRINQRGKNAPEGFTLPKPEGIDKMFELASNLSKGLPYSRIDMYCVNEHPYFGEITFFPQSGFDRNYLPETEIMYGELIHLPKKTISK